MGCITCIAYGQLNNCMDGGYKTRVCLIRVKYPQHLHNQHEASGM
jgi:hypothetical protein